MQRALQTIIFSTFPGLVWCLVYLGYTSVTRDWLITTFVILLRLYRCHTIICVYQNVPICANVHRLKSCRRIKFFDKSWHSTKSKEMDKINKYIIEIWRKFETANHYIMKFKKPKISYVTLTKTWQRARLERPWLCNKIWTPKAWF